MKTRDQIIIAFLVSAGLFSMPQARQYVSTLSAKAKKQLVSVSVKVPLGTLVAGSDPAEVYEVKKKA